MLTLINLLTWSETQVNNQRKREHFYLTLQDDDQKGNRIAIANMLNDTPYYQTLTICFISFIGIGLTLFNINNERKNEDSSL